MTINSFIVEQVPPSESNVMLPPETTQYFTALTSGGFVPCSKGWTPMPVTKTKSLEQQRAENMADNARRLEQLGLTSVGVRKTKRSRKCSTPWSGKTPSVCPPMSRRKDKIPSKKIRFESHPLLCQRVSVVWNELNGPK